MSDDEQPLGERLPARRGAAAPRSPRKGRASSQLPAAEGKKGTAGAAATASESPAAQPKGAAGAAAQVTRRQGGEKKPLAQRPQQRHQRDQQWQPGKALGRRPKRAAERTGPTGPPTPEPALPPSAVAPRGDALGRKEPTAAAPVRRASRQPAVTYADDSASGPDDDASPELQPSFSSDGAAAARRRRGGGSGRQPARRRPAEASAGAISAGAASAGSGGKSAPAAPPACDAGGSGGADLGPHRRCYWLEGRPDPATHPLTAKQVRATHNPSPLPNPIDSITLDCSFPVHPPPACTQRAPVHSTVVSSDVTSQSQLPTPLMTASLTLQSLHSLTVDKGAIAGQGWDKHSRTGIDGIICRWGPPKIAQWLSFHGLSKYAPKFADFTGKVRTGERP